MAQAGCSSSAAAQRRQRAGVHDAGRRCETSTHSGGGDSPASAARPRLTPAPNPRLRPGRTTRTGVAGRSAEELRRARASTLPAAPFSTTTTGLGAVVEQRADAAVEQRPGVVVDHDGADRGRTPRAQYSLVKRNLTSALMAPNPSRQVIFLPSSGSRPA